MSSNLLSESQLREQADIVRRELVNHIRQCSRKYSISYQKLSDACGFKYNMRRPLERRTIGKILGFLLKEEYKVKRPVLTSIIYLSGLYIQGKGFFRLLQEENIENAGSYSLEKLKRLDFRRKLEKEAIDFWRDDVNYQRFSEGKN